MAVDGGARSCETFGVHVNVPVDEENQARIVREEEYWNAKRMMPLFAVFLGFCLVLLYCMSNYLEWMGAAKP